MTCFINPHPHTFGAVLPLASGLRGRAYMIYNNRLIKHLVNHCQLISNSNVSLLVIWYLKIMKVCQSFEFDTNYQQLTTNSQQPFKY